MPSRDIIGSLGVSENVLLPHLRKGKQSGGVISGFAEEAKDYYQCGESIVAGMAVGLANGKIYKASKGTLSSVGIAEQSAESGEMLSVVSGGVVSSVDYDFVVGGDVYLNEFGGMTTDIMSMASGEVLQKMGIALSSKTIYVMIGDAVEVE